MILIQKVLGVMGISIINLFVRGKEKIRSVGAFVIVVEMPEDARKWFWNSSEHSKL